MPSNSLDPSTELKKRSNDGDAIDQRLAEIHALIEVDDFACIEKLVAELPELVEAVPLAEREAALIKLQGCLQGIHARAAAKSDQISSKLDTLSNGRIATNAYQAAAKIPSAR